LGIFSGRKNGLSRFSLSAAARYKFGNSSPVAPAKKWGKKKWGQTPFNEGTNPKALQ
jgi:hypothetical protein